MRYQPDSLDGLELSQVARADYAQLAPDRFLNVTRSLDGASIVVRLSGPDGPTVSGAGVGQAWLEQKDPTVTSDELGWAPVGAPTGLSVTGTAGSRLWSGQLKVPRDAGRLRLVVQQYEVFPADSTGIVLVPAKVRRLVHSDIVEL